MYKYQVETCGELRNPIMTLIPTESDVLKKFFGVGIGVGYEFDSNFDSDNSFISIYQDYVLHINK